MKTISPVTKIVKATIKYVFFGLVLSAVFFFQSKNYAFATDSVDLKVSYPDFYQTILGNPSLPSLNDLISGMLIVDNKPISPPDGPVNISFFGVDLTLKLYWNATITGAVEPCIQNGPFVGANAPTSPYLGSAKWAGWPTTIQPPPYGVSYITLGGFDTGPSRSKSFTFTITCPSASGNVSDSVIINATQYYPIDIHAVVEVNGAPQTDLINVNYEITGPNGINLAGTQNRSFFWLPHGTYTLTYQSGGPAGATFTGLEAFFLYDPVIKGVNSVTFTVTDFDSTFNKYNRNSAVVIMNFTIPPPNAPSSLTGTPICAGSNNSDISLNWSDKSNNEQSFKIYRGTSSGFIPNDSGNLIAVTTANSNTYTDTTPAPSTTYYYKIKAYNGAGDSSYASTAGITTNSCAPTFILTPASATIQKGQTQQFDGKYDSDGPGGGAAETVVLRTSIAWSSSVTTVATVNNSGLATGVVTNGNTVIQGIYNSKTATANLTVSTPQPDLTASTPTPINPTSGSILFSSTIANGGTAGTGAGFTNIFQVSLSSNGNNPTNYNATTASSLDAGASVATSKSITLTAGVYYMRVCADSDAFPGDGTITESNENNNCSSGVPWTRIEVTDLPQCQDTIDNDLDGKIDFGGGNPDPGCSSLIDNDETDPSPQCQDTIDNDGDGKIDLADPGCSTSNDNDETDPSPTSGSCALTHYNCATGIIGSKENNTSNWTWTCAGSDGILAQCSENKRKPTFRED